MDSETIGALWLAVLFPLSIAFLVVLHRRWFRSPTAATEPPLWGVLEVLAVILCWFCAQIFFMVAINSLGWDTENPDAQLVSQLLTVAVVFTFVCLCLERLGQPIATVGFTGSAPLNFVLLPFFYVASYAVIVIPVSFFWQSVLELLGVPIEEQPLIDVYRSQLRNQEYGQMSFFIVNAVVVAPFVEELVFRGFFFGAFVRRLGFWLPALVSSALFSFVHLSLAALLPLFAVGMILCYVYRKTGSLYCSILYHGIFNGASLALLVLKEFHEASG